MSSFWLVLFSSRVFHNGTYILCWTSTSLAYQPKSRERSARPAKRVTFALSEQNSANQARTRELDEDEDDQPLVRPDRTAVSEDEDDKPLVQLASREEPLKRESSAERSVPTPLPVEQDVSGTSRERSEDVSSVGKNSDGEALQKNFNKLSDVRNLKDLHLKHYHMSSAQFKKRTTNSLGHCWKGL